MRKTANLLLIQGKKYLLQHRDNIPVISEPDTYSVWGGTLEGDELPEAGAVRELKEETGLDIASSRLKPVGIYNVPHAQVGMEKELVEMHIFSLELEPDEKPECFEGQGIVSFPIRSGLNPKMNSTTKLVIADYERTT